MGVWKGPVGREVKFGLAIIWATFVAGALLNAAFLMEGVEGWLYMISFVPLSAIFAAGIAYFWRDRETDVWRSVHLSSEMDRGTVVEALERVLNARPVPGRKGAVAFHVGDASVIVRGRGTGTEVYLGPVEEADEVERLKAVVEEAIR